VAGVKDIFYYNTLFYARTKRFQIMLPLAVIISFINTFLVDFHVVPKPPNAYLFTEANLGYSEILFILIASMFAGDLVSRDFSKEGLFILTQPFQREKIFGVKLLSSVLASTLVVLAYLAGSFASTFILYRTIIPSWWEILGISVLGIVSLVSFVSLFSASVKSPTVSITISIFVLLIGFPLIQSILGYLNMEPFFLITYALEAITNLAEKTYPPHVVKTVGLNGDSVSFNPTIPESVVIFMAYLIVGVVLCLLIYKRRQLADV